MVNIVNLLTISCYLSFNTSLKYMVQKCWFIMSMVHLEEDARRYGPLDTFRDNLKISVKAFAINPNTWEHASQDRAK